MSKKVAALIAAAGRGTRMGPVFLKKQYHPLGDRPILAHTLAIFQESPLITDIVLVVAPEDIPYCRRELVDKYGFSKVGEIVAGGESRTDSVYQGLLALGANTHTVLVHDGVRPLLPPGLIAKVVQAVRTYGAAVVAVPVKDTIKICDRAGFVAQTPDRNTLWAVQTPQAFSYSLLLKAHEAARKSGLAATDDAMLVEALGQRIKLVPGSYENLKITTPEDMDLARALLKRRQ
ncbi:MAG: 2-C-methyl-D-erythritol 4-phosphate cytidylyltransferase [Firmicutes bacterium]|nr:2-C-methyl-D-erythritol 4-phosphate cytidylyltransferase [Bacillota bacterium]